MTKPVFLSLSLLLLTLSAQWVQADSTRCFSVAESYYEQLYCELQAKGEGARLPSYFDFQRNNVQMQALLLKPVAARHAINVTMPKGAKPAKAVALESSPAQRAPRSTKNCHRQGLQLHCGGRVFQHVANQGNEQLQSGVLDAGNQMSLPGYQPGQGTVDDYLRSSYEHYLNKMLAIGLGGSTLSYGKFSYLFDDLRQRGVSFSGRFEKMYYYLKRDKLQLNAPTKALPGKLQAEHCYALQSLMVCYYGRSNYVFVPRAG